MALSYSGITSNHIKGGISSEFLDSIFSSYFNENDGFFTMHDTSQKIPVINVYQAKSDKVEENTDVFIVDIALGLYSKEDLDLEVIEDHGRYFFSISAKKVDLPDGYKPILKQISTNTGKRMIEFKNKIESTDVWTLEDKPGIVRIKITTKDTSYKSRKIKL